MYEREPEPPITRHSEQTAGAEWLRGYVDALHHKQPAQPGSLAYKRGYAEGLKARRTHS